MENIINVKHKDKDLITLDLRTKQIRFLKNHFKGEHNLIRFMNLSNSDVEGYDYLFNEDLNLMFKSLREDIYNFIGILLTKKDLEIIKEIK